MGGSHRASVSGEEKDPFRFRHMIPTSALQVRALTGADGDSAAVCEIIHVKSESEGRPERVFHLCCSSAESKKDFVRTVHSILRDKQRRQLLKTESLPPSQQYVPFGGKRLCALKGARPSINRAASAPTRTLGRRKLVRNRFTIDTDIVFDEGPAAGLGPAGETERWLEEQFDLKRYEDQPKETDILSDEDEPQDLAGATETELEPHVCALSLTEEEQKDSKSQHALRLSHLAKQSAVSEASVDEQLPGSEANEDGNDEEGVIWVRRNDDDSVPES